MKPSQQEPFSRYQPREPAAHPIRICLSQRQYDGLLEVAEMVCPAVPGSKIGGVAEAVRRAIDFCLSQDAFLSHAGESAKDKLTEAVSARLSRSQIDKLDSLAADNAAQLERLASAGGRRGPQRYRGGLIRAAIDLYLTRSPEAKKAAADYARKSRHERSVTSPLEETANVNAPSTVSPRKSKEAKHSSH